MEIAGQLRNGNTTNVVSYMQNNAAEDVASTFKNQSNKKLAAFIYDIIIVRNLGRLFRDQIIRILEILAQAEQCEKVFSILQEIHVLSGGDENILDKLQEEFSSSKIVFECVKKIHVIQLLEMEGFVADGETVAAQDPCVEVTNCNFVLQATRFLLVPQLCDARRVCNFLGFEQREICQRECEN
eukprot:TRINITY_DN37190_c0_g1_i6.p2 TRINITY_DN37190_c0_g1~~TRINITY_DN37190_c0_g1_i6.p2  ORF type:complete len:184 (-),score=17.90 TRINITY_DN37190_c0_g1_i6:106-657(-)